MWSAVTEKELNVGISPGNVKDETTMVVVCSIRRWNAANSRWSSGCSLAFFLEITFLEKMR